MKAAASERDTRQVWRSLVERAGAETDAAEFAAGADLPPEGQDRRRFLQLMGASFALAGAGGLGGCIGPPERSEELVPYVEAPEQVVPGRPLFFATAFSLAGYAHGVLAESHFGRPTKLEGNPSHPASLGAADAWTQASILDLYDPDRSQTVRLRGETSSWEAFAAAMRALRAEWSATGGRGLAVLTGSVASPTLAHQLRTLLRTYPQAAWYRHEPAAADRRRAALENAEPRYRLDRARVVVALDSDFLLMEPGSVRYARDFAAGRRVRVPSAEAAETATMSRVYAAEPTPTLTGAAADHRLPVRPSELPTLAASLAATVGGDGSYVALPVPYGDWVRAAADDLRAHAGAGLVVAGETAPPAVHAIVRRINEALGNVGQTVDYAPPIEAQAPSGDLAALTVAMEAGRVNTLLMLGGNPVHTAPADVPFADALDGVPRSIHLSPTVDETSWRSVWHLPQTHFLEAWSDVRAFDGTATIQQPLIAPLYEPARSAHVVVEVLHTGADRSDYELVRAFWADRLDENQWRRALHDGVVVDGGSESVDGGPASAPTVSPSPARPFQPTGFELDIRPDDAVFDGRFAGNAWLQELPRPLTKLVWDNAALVAPADARRLGLIDEFDDLRWREQTREAPVVELAWRGRTVEAPVFVHPGQAEGVVTIHLGYGRERAGRVGSGVGFDAYRLRTSDAPWGGPGLEIRPTGATHTLVTTQGHARMEGRAPVRTATLGTFRRTPDFPEERETFHDLPTLLPGYDYPGYKWGMVIDPTLCIGCNACVAACQAENNIPVVGKEQVRRQREMHWLRVDRYYVGAAEDPAVVFQPLPCQHCEHAPCEVVCPVAATVHDADGLNVMVYNRCIGTRYCSNNCPYKVRRFNFLQYADWGEHPTLEMQRNPDVTVRTRGVMEKCTYCVQRIASARSDAQAEGRRIRDGEVVTACQATCPTEAIVFGDYNDPESRLNEAAKQPHAYALLRELGTRPRTRYLGHLSNPAPSLGTPSTASDA